MKKVLIALSGGVDSSVAAHLMQENGFECIGATMQLLDNTEAQIRDAESVAEKLGIPFYSFDMRTEFKSIIIDGFIQSYENGETPNPCVKCNQAMKFGLLLKKAEELGCETLVTGHYAKIENSNGRFILKKAENPQKDQSYFLYSLSQSQLSHVEFPLGDYSKDEIRIIADNLKLITARKKDSQDICFVPDGDYVRVIEEYRGKSYPKGNFVDCSGNVLGQHQGIISYTVGQRKGLGVAFGKPMYVKSKCTETNEVVLCDNESLFSDTVTVKDLNWIAFEKAPDSFRCSARIRYRHIEQPATVSVTDGIATIKFDEPQRAVTPGQSAVFYDGDTVLGGGIIVE